MIGATAHWSTTSLRICRWASTKSPWRRWNPSSCRSSAAATLRGAFGWSYKQLVCYQPWVTTCRVCLLAAQCPYPQVFEPVAKPGTLYENLQNVPAPYVLRPPTRNERAFGPGRRFAFQVVLLGHVVGLLPYFAVALQQLQKHGLGRGRGRARVVAIEALHPDGTSRTMLYCQDRPDVIHNHPGWPATAWVDPRPAPAQVTVEFLTPARLVSEQRLHALPEFHIFYRALLRRASALTAYYAERPWETDFPDLAEAAHAVTTVLAETRTAWRGVSPHRKARWYSCVVVRGGSSTPAS